MDLRNDDNFDKYDFLMAAVTGVFSGLLDVFFVGKPGDGLLGQWTDRKTNDLVMKFAEHQGYTPKGGAHDMQNAVQFLERSYKVGYDHATSSDTGGMVSHLSTKNHHLKSIGHNPDLVGLSFSIMDQFQGKSSFLDNGKLIRINSDCELEGGNFVSKVYAGAGNWFGHIMSDVAGSSGAIGNGGRGSGIPIPFYQMFNLCDFGEFGQYRQPLSTIMVQVFEQGYDLRHGAAMAIPPMIGDLLTMLSWSIKRKFYHNWEWRQCIPSDEYKSYRWMQLINKGAFCLVDGVDAYIRGAGNPIAIILHMNLIAWLLLVRLIMKEIFRQYGRTYKDIAKDVEIVNRALAEELERLREIDYASWKVENEKVAELNKRLSAASIEETGVLASEYCFNTGANLNFSNKEECISLIKAKKPLW